MTASFRAWALILTALPLMGLTQACSRPTLVGPSNTSNAATVSAQSTPAASLITYTASQAAYMQGFAIDQNTPALSGPATIVSYQVDPALPAGITLHPTTGVITGIPTTVVAEAQYTVQATTQTGETISVPLLLSVGSSDPDPAQSDMIISPPNIAYAGTATLTLTLRNAAGQRIPDSGLASRLAAQLLTSGSSAVTIGPFHAANNPGIYQATLTGITSGTSNKLQLTYSTTQLTSQPSFKVLPGPPGKITVELGDAQTGTVGAALPAQLVAKVTDVNNVPVSGATVNWSIVTGGGTFTSTSSISDASGFAKITWTLGSTVGAQSARAGVATAVPATFNATAVSDVLAKFVFSNVSTSVNAGASFNFTVTAVDRFGNTVTNYTGPIHFTSSDPFSATLPADTSFTTADAGARVFSATLTTSGIQTVTAGAGSVTQKSSNIIVVPAGATKLLMITGPGNAKAGQSIGSVLIRAVDPYGNTVTTFTDPITLAIDTNPSSGTLSGTKTVSAIAGSATFAGLSIDKVGTGYTIKATSGGMVPATSSGFDISPGAASALVAVSGGAQSAADTTTLPAPFVAAAQDAYGNAVPGAKISWFVTTGGGTISPTLTTTDSNGTGSSTLTLGSIIGTQSVQATLQSTSISITFSATAIAGPPASITITSGNNQSGIAGTAMATPLVVTVKDAGGNLLQNTQIDWAFTTTPAGSLSAITGTTDTTGKTSTLLTLSNKAGPNTISATVHGTTIAATFTATGAPSMLVWQFGGTQFASGRCLPVSIAAMDPSGSTGNVMLNTTVTLATTGSGAFYSDSACTTASVITSAVIAIGTSSKGLYYLDRLAENVTVTGTDTSGPLTMATLPVAFGPARIIWRGTTATQAGFCMVYTLSLVDDLGNIAPALSTLSAQLTVTNSSTGKFYTSSGCVTQMSSVTFNAGGSATVYFKDTAMGTPVLTASDNTGMVSQAKINLALISISQFGQTGGGSGLVRQPVITHDASGNLYVAASTNGNLINGYGSSTGAMDLYLAKFDSSGAPLWAIQKGPNVAAGYNIYSSGIVTDASGNIYVAGHTTLNLTTYAGPWTAGNLWSMFVMKLNSSGVQQWVTQVGVPGKNTQSDQSPAGNLSIDSSGNLLIAGYTNGNYPAGTGASPSGFQEALLVKLDSSGAVLWGKQLGTTGGATWGGSSTFDSAGNTYISGRTSGNLVTGTGPPTGNSDAFIAKYDASGVFKWIKQYGYAPYNSWGNALIADSAGNVYMTGGSVLNMATGSGMAQSGTGTGFLVKYDSTGTQKWGQLIKSGGGYSIQAYGLTIDASGNFLVTGYAYTVLGAIAGEVNYSGGPATASAEAFLARYDSSGTLLGVSQKGALGKLASFTTIGYGVTTSSTGDIYIVALTGADMVNGAYYPKGGQADLAVLKFNSTGVYQSVKQIGSANAVINSRSLAMDSSGNSYLVGETQITLSTGQHSIGSPDGFIIKAGPSGARLWTAQIGQIGGSTFPTAVGLDSSGNIYVSGYSSANFVAGSGTTTATYEYFVAKYDSSGTQLWLKQSSTAAGKTTYANSMAVDGSGNSYITGYTNANVMGTAGYPKSPNSFDMFVVKYDSTGALIWTKQIGYAINNRIVQANGVALDSTGNPIVTGETNTNLTTGALQTSRSVFVIKFNTAGTQQWVTQTPDALYARMPASGTMIAVDTSNNIFVTGLTYSNLVAGTGASTGASDYFVLKLDSTGTQKWVRQKGMYYAPTSTGLTAWGSGIATDGAGSVYITGRANGDIVSNSYNPNGNIDAIFAKYDLDGNEQWVRQFLRPQTTSTGAALDPSTGNICFAGFTNANLTAQNGGPAGQLDSWIAKFPP